MRTRAEAVQAAEELWQLLDDIDTLDDACRDNDAVFRERVRKRVGKRMGIMSSDGYKILWKGDPIPESFKSEAEVDPSKLDRSPNCGSEGKQSQ